LAPTIERPARNQYEARLIQLLKGRFAKSNLGVDDYEKIGELPLEIDMVVKCLEQNWTPDFAKFPRLFDYFRRYNIIEIKTEQDRLEVKDLPKLLAYGWHYMAKSGLENVREVTLTALVHHLTPQVQEALPKFGFELKAPNVYRRDSDMEAFVIAFADLPDELLPEELRAFTSPARRQQLFVSCLGDQEKISIVEVITDLFASEVKKIMQYLREESLKTILSAVGEKRIISALGEKNVISALGEENVISALGEEKIISTLGKQKLLAALNREDLIAALGGSENLLKTLLATLKPEQLREMLEATGRN